MTANRRIVLNIVATYGRSLYALACGLFVWRWVLMALGEVDYGLVGVVGGLTGFVTFINSILSVSVGRFYAFSVGAASVADDPVNGIEECRKWFNTAFFIHTIVSVVLVSVGYPIGLWAVREFLSIPPDRVDACVWLWRFVCVSCFVGMFTVPFCAMYTAKQYIAELTVYSFVTSTLNVVVLYYMVTHPGDWLVRYSFWTMLVVIVPNIIIATRALVVFDECRFNRRYFFSWNRVRQLMTFGGGRALGMFSTLLSNQCVAIAVNKFLGPARNATMSLGRGVMAHTMSLAGAMSGAFAPAITTAAGAGDYERMHRLVFATCTYSTLGMLIFSIPFCLEADEILRLWLGNPPEYAASFCVCLAVLNVIERICEGHWMAIFAMGKVVKFQLVEAISGIIDLTASVLFISLGYGIIGVGVALILGRFYAMIVKAWYGYKCAGVPVKIWSGKVCVPLVTLSLITAFVGYLPRYIWPQGLLRVAVTTVVSLSVMIPLAWGVVLSRSDREILLEKFKKISKW